MTTLTRRKQMAAEGSGVLRSWLWYKLTAGRCWVYVVVFFFPQPRRRSGWTLKLAVGRFIALNGDFPRDEMVGGFCVVYTVRPQYGNWRSKKKKENKKREERKEERSCFLFSSCGYWWSWCLHRLPSESCLGWDKSRSWSSNCMHLIFTPGPTVI